MKSIQQDIDKLVIIGEKLLDSPINETTFRTIYLKSILRKSISTSKTVLMLLDYHYYELYTTIDDGMIASSSRNLIDLSRMINYMNEPEIENEEKEFRELCWSYHVNKTKYNIAEKIGNYEQNILKHTLFSFTLSVRHKQLLDNKLFQEMNKKDRKDIELGRKFIFTNRIKQRRSPLESSREQGIYDLFSNEIHSLPLGINFRTTTEGLYSTLSIIDLCLKIVVLYLAYIISEYVRIRKKASGVLTKEEKLSVKEFFSYQSHVKEWCETQIDIYTSED